MLSNEQYESVLRKIVDNLVYQPSMIKIRAISDGRGGVDLFVNCHADYGLIIGGNGRTIKAIQSLFRNIGKNQNDIVAVKVKAENDRRDVPPVRLNGQNWNEKKTKLTADLIKETASALGFESSVKAEEFHDTTLITLDSKLPQDQFEDIDWILKMIFKHNGRKLAIQWRQ